MKEKTNHITVRVEMEFLNSHGKKYLVVHVKCSYLSGRFRVKRRVK